MASYWLGIAGRDGGHGSHFGASEPRAGHGERSGDGTNVYGTVGTLAGVTVYQQ